MNFTGPKIFFVDLDGTLLDSPGKELISNANLEAIHRIRKYAHLVISTGRSFNDTKMQRVQKMVNSEYLICSSGAQIYHNNKVVNSTTIEQIAVLETLEFAKKYKIPFILSTESEDFLCIFSFFQKIFWSMVFKKEKQIINVLKEEIPRKKFLKILFLTCPLKTQKILNNLDLEVKGVTVYTSHKNWAIEITNQNVDKASADLLVATYLNINPIETIHIGDSLSDSAPKGVVGKVVAMGNASQDFKDIADVVGPDYKEGGFALLVNGLLDRTIKE